MAGLEVNVTVKSKRGSTQSWFKQLPIMINSWAPIMSDIITSWDSVKAEECSAIQIQVLSCLSWLCGAVLVLSALGFFIMSYGGFQKKSSSSMIHSETPEVYYQLPEGNGLPGKIMYRLQNDKTFSSLILPYFLFIFQPQGFACVVWGFFVSSSE